MAIMDDIVRTTHKAGEILVDTAVGAYDYSRISYRIASLENRYKTVLAKIGEYVLNKEEGKLTEDEDVSDLVAQASKLRKKILWAKSIRAQILDQIACPECGKNNPKDSTYCNGCGHHFEK